MDVEWLLSTLFDASLLKLSSRRQRRLFFCPVSGQIPHPHGYHFVNSAAAALDRRDAGGQFVGWLGEAYRNE